VARQPVPRDSRQLRGKAAEDLAAAYLENRGLAVLARNLRCKGGELDILCRDGAVLVVVEVRQRSSARFGGALASVTRQKQRRMIRAARFHLQRHAAWQHCVLRFDVVGLDGLPGGLHRLAWVKDAFRAT
jgi:putative endonuclease